jgi:hypothetical protein
MASFIENFNIKEFTMSALDKLINLIEEIKITSPDLKSRADNALDALLASDKMSDAGKQPPELEPAPEPEPEPEPFDDSYIEFDKQIFNSLVLEQQNINDLIASYGVFVLEHERKKIELSKEIEKRQEILNQKTKNVMKDIGCDPEASYALKFPKNENENPAFEKQ